MEIVFNLSEVLSTFLAEYQTSPNKKKKKKTTEIKREMIREWVVKRESEETKGNFLCGYLPKWKKHLKRNEAGKR